MELLVALFLSALVLTLSYQFFNFIERSGKLAAETSSLQALAPVLFYVALKDFESADYSYAPLSVLRPEEGKVSVSFYTKNCYHFGGVCKVSYFSEGKLLIRKEERINSVGEGGVETPLSFKVSSLNLFSKRGAEWREIEEGSSRPSVIKLLFKIEEKGELPIVVKIRTSG